MAISENAAQFFACKVKDFTSAEDWEGPDMAYRLRTSWDDEAGTLHDRLDELLEQPDIQKLKALVIGMWGSESDFSSTEIIQQLVKRKKSFAGLRAIFLGDITYEENEISWIQQSNISPLLRAFPQLEVLRVRGGNGLAVSRIQHAALQQLIIETGGLPRAVIRAICRCEFPNLRHLELWLGSENYGWDGGVEDLQPILSGNLFPHLESLGLCNSEVIDEIAPVVVNAPLVKRLKVLDLSKGNLSDVGGQALFNLPRDGTLQELHLTHHYLSKDLVKRLRKELPCKVSADDPMEEDGEWRGILASE